MTDIKRVPLDRDAIACVVEIFESSDKISLALKIAINRGFWGIDETLYFTFPDCLEDGEREASGLDLEHVLIEEIRPREKFESYGYVTFPEFYSAAERAVRRKSLADPAIEAELYFLLVQLKDSLTSE
jgi:hypothetical protein